MGGVGGEGVHYSHSHMGKGGITFVWHVISEQFICCELNLKNTYQRAGDCGSLL